MSRKPAFHISNLIIRRLPRFLKAPLRLRAWGLVTTLGPGHQLRSIRSDLQIELQVFLEFGLLASQGVLRFFLPSVLY